MALLRQVPFLALLLLLLLFFAPRALAADCSNKCHRLFDRHTRPGLLQDCLSGCSTCLSVASDAMRSQLQLDPYFCSKSCRSQACVFGCIMANCQGVCLGDTPYDDALVATVLPGCRLSSTTSLQDFTAVAGDFYAGCCLYSFQLCTYLPNNPVPLPAFEKILARARQECNGVVSPTLALNATAAISDICQVYEEAKSANACSVAASG